MRKYNQSSIGGPSLEAPDPTRTAVGTASGEGVYVYDGQGTGREQAAIPDGRLGLWHARWRQWRDGFEQVIGPNVRRYWNLYRAFDSSPLPGPRQSWRDRTVIPTCYKIIETRLPRLVMGQFGAREWFTVEGRDARDESYEEMVRVLLRTKIDQIGIRDYSDGGFYKRMIDGMRYCQIMGHAWFKTWWRKESRWLKTKIPIEDEDGKVVAWESIEVEDPIYDNIDVTWLPLDSLAVDIHYGHGRRWSIERVFTSLQSLKAENEEYKRKYGIELYPADKLAEIETHGSTIHRDSYEEPRDTEHWPITRESITSAPGETTVELWLCWDNQEMTLTKIANRTVELDHGLAPTPDGLDPYLGLMAIPIPGRIYGESYLHYVGPLATYQTRIARARADEVMLNIWQQFVFREGAVRSSQFLFVPGGAMEIEQSDASRPIADNIMVLPRRPVFQEAYQEEIGRQRQAEEVAAADATVQGNEPTQKSRDVSATEIQQRVLQGASRYQMENLYLEVSFKKPLMGKMFDLIRQNMTSEQTIRVLGKDVTVDLRSLDRPIDIVVGGGIMETTKAERIKEVETGIQLSESPVFGPYLKAREILVEMYKNNFERKDPARFVRTEAEVEAKRQADLAAAMAQASGANGGGPPMDPNAAGTPTGASAGANSGPGGLTNASGASPEASPGGSEAMVEELS